MYMYLYISKCCTVSFKLRLVMKTIHVMHLYILKNDVKRKIQVMWRHNCACTSLMSYGSTGVAAFSSDDGKLKPRCWPKKPINRPLLPHHTLQQEHSCTHWCASIVAPFKSRSIYQSSQMEQNHEAETLAPKNFCIKCCKLKHIMYMYRKLGYRLQHEERFRNDVICM